MEVLLIYPPYERLMGLHSGTFPVSIALIATMLKHDGYDVKLYNAEVGKSASKAAFSYTPDGRSDAFSCLGNAIHGESPVWDEIREVISNAGPRIVGITSYAPTHAIVRRIAAIAKEECNARTVVGGPYPTLLPEEVCSDDNIDFAVAGEGEYTMLELAALLLREQGSAENIKGLSYKKDGRVFSNAARERIEDIDKLPFIDHDVLMFKEAHSPEALATLMASRGCPHRCAFCASVPLWGRKVVFRLPDSILDEIERNHKLLKNRSFTFFDDTFTSDLKKVCEFCEKFIERGLHKKLSWVCLSRVNTVNEKLVRLLEKANCSRIDLGVESGCERILKTLKKDITKDMVRKKVALVRKSKLLLHLFFMIGSPCETEEDILETNDFIRELRPDSINLCTFTPYYGTELYDYCVEKGLIPGTHDISLYEKTGHHNKKNYFCTDIPQQRYYELVEMTMKLADEINGGGNMKKRILKLKRYLYYISHPACGYKVLVNTLKLKA